MGYAEALRRERWQKDVLGWGVWAGGVGVTGLALAGAWAGRGLLNRSR